MTAARLSIRSPSSTPHLFESSTLLQQHPVCSLLYEATWLFPVPSLSILSINPHRHRSNLHRNISHQAVSQSSTRSPIRDPPEVNSNKTAASASASWCSVSVSIPSPKPPIPKETSLNPARKEILFLWGVLPVAPRPLSKSSLPLHHVAQSNTNSQTTVLSLNQKARCLPSGPSDDTFQHAFGRLPTRNLLHDHQTTAHR